MCCATSGDRHAHKSAEIDPDPMVQYQSLPPRLCGSQARSPAPVGSARHSPASADRARSGRPSSSPRNMPIDHIPSAAAPGGLRANASLSGSDLAQDLRGRVPDPLPIERVEGRALGTLSLLHPGRRGAQGLSADRPRRSSPIRRRSPCGGRPELPGREPGSAGRTDKARSAAPELRMSA